MHPRLIPVLDVMNGQVVRAVGGRRERYEPVRCPLTGSGKPYDLASARIQKAEATELYIADLDAILGKPRVSRAVLSILEMIPLPVWLDAGIGRKLNISDLPDFPHLRPVIGSETCGSPELLARSLRETTRPCAFSIDLNDGRLIGDCQAWGLEGNRDVLSLARRAIGMGVRTIIVIDLARVGTGTGCGTENLLRAIRAEFPETELIAGGGIRTRDDVHRLGEAGADAVLVASALHDGTLTA